MAYKVFSNGDALTGSELNTYLMNQSVMVFATTTARDAALTTPSEGMLVWLEDSDKYVKYVSGAWADLISAAGSGNAIINGAFDIWQRGTSVNAGVFTYVSDRWATVATHSGGTVTYTKQTFTPGSSPIAGVPNYIRMTATSPTGASANAFYQRIEDVNTFAGQTVTLSFYAKADASRSIFLNPFQDFGSGGSSQVGITGTTFSATTSMQRFTYTFAVPSITGKTVGNSSYLGIELQFPVNTTSTIEITGVQLEAGSTATAFKRNASNIQGELAACQRYYFREGGIDTYQWMPAYSGIGVNSTTAEFIVNHPVSFRERAFSIDYSTLAVRDITNVFYNATNIVIARLGKNTTYISVTVASGLTAQRPYHLVTNNSTSAYLGLSSEL